MVVADSYQQARQAVRLAKIEYVPETPILTIQDAIEKESWVLPPVDFSHGEVERHFKMHHIIFQVLLSWVGKSIFISKDKFPMRFHKRIRA